MGVWSSFEYAYVDVYRRIPTQNNLFTSKLPTYLFAYTTRAKLILAADKNILLFVTYIDIMIITEMLRKISLRILD